MSLSKNGAPQNPMNHHFPLGEPPRLLTVFFLILCCSAKCTSQGIQGIHGSMGESPLADQSSELGTFWPTNHLGALRMNVRLMSIWLHIFLVSYIYMIYIYIRIWYIYIYINVYDMIYIWYDMIWYIYIYVRYIHVSSIISRFGIAKLSASLGSGYFWSSNHPGRRPPRLSEIWPGSYQEIWLF